MGSLAEHCILANDLHHGILDRLTGIFDRENIGTQIYFSIFLVAGLGRFNLARSNGLFSVRGYHS